MVRQFAMVDIQPCQSFGLFMTLFSLASPNSIFTIIGVPGTEGNNLVLNKKKNLGEIMSTFVYEQKWLRQAAFFKLTKME